MTHKEKALAWAIVCVGLVAFLGLLIFVGWGINHFGIGKLEPSEEQEEQSWMQENIEILTLPDGTKCAAIDKGRGGTSLDCSW